MKYPVIFHKRAVLAGIVVLLIFIIFYILVRFFPIERVCFDEACLGVELALTPQKRSQGLMFREYLPRNRGMLFVFDSDDYWVFWMKNTHVPLDMIWLNADRQVVHIVKNVPVDKGENIPQYAPAVPARYVLETNAGFCGKYNIKLGDEAKFKWIFLPEKI